RRAAAQGFVRPAQRPRTTSPRGSSCASAVVYKTFSADGCLTAARYPVRASEGGRVSLWQDFRLAVRLLVKDKWFTAVAAMPLALGIGVNTTVFTFANAVVLRGLPFADPDSIISISMTDARGRFLGVSRLDLADYRDGSRAFSHLAALTGASLNVSEQGRPAEQYQGT